MYRQRVVYGSVQKSSVKFVVVKGEILLFLTSRDTGQSYYF